MPASEGAAALARGPLGAPRAARAVALGRCAARSRASPASSGEARGHGRCGERGGPRLGHELRRRRVGGRTAAPTALKPGLPTVPCTTLGRVGQPGLGASKGGAGSRSGRTQHCAGPRAGGGRRWNKQRPPCWEAGGKLLPVARLTAPRLSRRRMTVKLGDAGSGEEGLKKLGKRTADEESLDGEGPGGADAAEDSSSTKRDGQTPRASGAPAPPRGLPAPSPPQGSPQDQHHFLRSSVRPQSKRPRKDAPCAVGSGGASGSGPRGKGRDPILWRVARPPWVALAGARVPFYFFESVTFLFTPGQGAVIVHFLGKRNRFPKGP